MFKSAKIRLCISRLVFVACFPLAAFAIFIRTAGLCRKANLSLHVSLLHTIGTLRCEKTGQRSKQVQNVTTSLDTPKSTQPKETQSRPRTAVVVRRLALLALPLAPRLLHLRIAVAVIGLAAVQVLAALKRLWHSEISSRIMQIQINAG